MWARTTGIACCLQRQLLLRVDRNQNKHGQTSAPARVARGTDRHDVVMALYSYGRYSYGLDSCGPIQMMAPVGIAQGTDRHHVVMALYIVMGLYSHGRYSYGLDSCGPIQMMAPVRIAQGTDRDRKLPRRVCRYDLAPM